MINLTETNVKELESFLLEIPAKFANPILQFLGKLAHDQAPVEEAQEVKES